jgi:trimeric autotransporter adhesin
MKKIFTLLFVVLWLSVKSFAAVGPIGGTLSVCAGSTRTLSDTTAGGVWSSSNTAVASVGSASGIVSGISAGTANITYYVPGTGYTTATFTVYATPAAISGPTALCRFSTASLSDATGGAATWTSSNTSVATVNPTSGTVTGVTAGTTNITFTTAAGCFAYRTETVTPMPSSISGSSSVCVGNTLSLSDSVTGGIWISSNTAVATVSSGGIVYGVSAGTDIISYTIGSACGVARIITVTPVPAAISGPSTVAAGSTITLSDVTSGGTWSSGSTSIATVGISTGVVTGVAAGVVNIYYLMGGCGAYHTVTVTGTSGSVLPITGTTTACTGNTVTLMDSTSGGTWSSSNTSVATINATSGLVTAVAAGTTTITYTVGSSYVTTIFTVNASPAAVSGPTSVAVGSTITLSDATPGGTWSSVTPSIGTISSAGVVTGVSAGMCYLKYTVGSCFVYYTVSVTGTSTLHGIHGTFSACVGSTTTLSDSTSGGTWSSSNTSVATVNATSGVVTAVSAGTTNITYTAGSSYVTITFTVNASPAAVSGPTSIAVGSTATLSDATSGGTWTSMTPSIGTVSSSGVVTGVSAGICYIKYTVGGCFVYFTITVTSSGISPISGSTAACVGSTRTLTDATSGGSWSSSNTSVATINATTGVVTAVSPGTTTISYTVGSSFVTVTFTVYAVPAAISGSSTVCVGSTITLSDATSGGTWSSSDTSKATVNPTTGVVTGRSAGTVNIYYLNGGCGTYKILTVNPVPAAIAGGSTVCLGTSMTLSDATSGGTWSSSNTLVATVTSGGVVTGVSAGTATIYYVVGGCGVYKTVTVTTGVSSISGSSTVCVGATITLSDATSGGTWSSSNTSVATVNAAGVVTGVSAGVVNIYYVAGTCGTYKSVTVNPAPAAITGTATTTVGGTSALSDATSGGTWSSSNTAIATVSSSGVVYGVSAGSCYIIYTVGGCSAYVYFTVTTTSSIHAITGTLSGCAGSTNTLMDSTTGGTWSSSNTSVATVNATSGVVTAVAAGTTTITYTVGTSYVTAVFTVNPTPAAISGPTTVAVGSTITLSDATSGGTWLSTATSIATANSTTGDVTGVSAGTVYIRYAVGGCPVYKLITVTSSSISPISGTLSICTGTATTTLTDATSGGTWSSSNTSVATIGASTGTVYPVSGGTTTITYTVGSSYVTAVFTVNPAPAAISGPTTVAVGSTITLSDATPGGTWSSITPATGTVSSTGVVTGVSAGACYIKYTVGSCYVAIAITVTTSTPPPAITGTMYVCTGTTRTLADATTGGTWSSSNTSVATVGLTTGVVTGVSAGVTTITYATAGGYATASFTVNASPAAISGSSSLCVGSSITLSDATSGGTWSSSGTSIASVTSGGVVSGVSAGVVNIYYVAGTCGAYKSVTVNALPTLSVTTYPNVCLNGEYLAVGGAATYSWSGPGLSCTTCTSVYIVPSVSTTYTVTGTSAAGCSSITLISANANRISGFITYSGVLSTDSLKVWLIHFNPTDSSITALDSMYTCMSGGTPFYKFLSKPAGNYMVKAKLLRSVPGTSGYVPSYSLSTTHWYSAATVAHTSGADSLHINMVYGTVPTGPAFIGGYVYAGAGRGTADAPVSGMMILLKDAVTGEVLTYTYTDATGAYSFSNLAFGVYNVYPEEYVFNTIQSAPITLTASSESATGINFRQYLGSRIIKPMQTNSIKPITVAGGLSVYPNPTNGMLNVKWDNQAIGSAEVIVADMAGRVVYKSTISINEAAGQAQADLAELNDGVYLITIKGDNIYYTSKLVKQ